MRAVSWLLWSEMSATTTAAPSRANASAVVRPMPLPAPVTKATLPAKLPFSFVAAAIVLLLVIAGLTGQFGHGRRRTLMARRSSMALYPSAASVERQLQVEHLARLDLARPDPVHQVGQEPTDRGGAAVQVDVGEEQLHARERDLVGHPDVADMATGPGGVDGLHHRLLGADGLDHRVRAQSVGQVLDRRHAVVTAFGDDVGRAELQRQLLPRFVAGSSR